MAHRFSVAPHTLALALLFTAGSSFASPAQEQVAAWHKAKYPWLHHTGSGEAKTAPLPNPMENWKRSKFPWLYTSTQPPAEAAALPEIGSLEARQQAKYPWLRQQGPASQR